MTKPFRCHDAESCALGQNPCPSPDACGIKPEWKPVSFWQQVKDVLAVFTEPSCCNINGVQSCQQGRSCPVRDGSHKPSSALHEIGEPRNG